MRVTQQMGVFRQPLHLNVILYPLQIGDKEGLGQRMSLGKKVPRIVEDLIAEASIICLPNLFSTTLQPLGDHVPRNFEMELEPIAHMADPHGLVGIILRTDQTHGPLR
jgi:hypothetical protein